MRWMNLSRVMAFAVVLVVGVAVGYALKPTVDVRLCDPSQLGPAPPMFDPDNVTLKHLTNSPVVGPVVSGLRGWQPLGTVGPFVIHVNPKTGGYVIGENNWRGAVLMQETKDGRMAMRHPPPACG